MIVSALPRVPTLYGSCLQRALFSLFDGELFSRAVQFPGILLCLLKTGSLRKYNIQGTLKTVNAIVSLLNQAFFVSNYLALWPAFHKLFYALCPRQMKHLVWKRSHSMCRNNTYFYILSEKKGKLINDIYQSISEVLEEGTSEMWNCKQSLIRDAQMPTYKPSELFYI